MATGSYEAERDDWQAAVSRAASEGWSYVELTAFQDRFDALFGFLGSSQQLLERFDRVSIHAPVRLTTTLTDTVSKLERLEPLGGFDLVLHPDVYVHEPGVARLGARAVFENMDATKSFGCTVGDLQTVFDTFPEAGFCLDVAHVWTNDQSLSLGLDLLDAFDNRLRQLHVSGIELDGEHRPTTTEDLDRYAPLLDRCGRVPWLLEAELAQ